ncbi:RDD family protein [Micromonospora pallida]|uniref:RDD family protein n=1 Tax=Micromonospora pallida TaxID=145854 RepID=A0A1C6TEH9_9ACTN|nr:RDD family protein [Micromonospora pallida]SCL40139.1 RDD family protein [Micromonospora pallida]
MSVQPGWYVDPADPETQRYWDGEGWLGAPISAEATPPEGPPPAEPATPVTPAAPTSAPTGPVAGTPGSGPAGQPASPAYPPGGQFPPQAMPPGHAPPPPGYAPPPPHGYGPPHGHHPPPPPGHMPPPGYAPPPGYVPPPGWPYPGYPAQPPEPRPHGLALAGYGARFLARLIDFGIVLALNVVVNGWFVWRYVQEMTPVWREFGARVSSGSTSTDPFPPPGEQAGGLQVAILLIATALWFAYEVPSMASGGQTFGKRVMGIRAVPLAGDQPLGFGRSFRRWNTLGLPTLLWFCCGLGLLLQLLDALSPLFDHPLRQALHDKRAQTVVVQVPRTTSTPAEAHDRPEGDAK